MLAKLIGLVAPPLCIACGAHAGRAGALCRECRAWMQAARGGWVRVPAPSAAPGPAPSATPMPAPSAAPAPAPSAAPRAASIQCWTAFAYEGPAGALVRALKFRGRLAVADLMAAQLAALAPPDLLRGTLVPVPVHPVHARRRGVDHTGALAQALSRRTGLPLAACLVRSGDPSPQVGRGRRARIAGPLGSVLVRAGTRVPETAVLVDDVITTGATLAACIGALCASGTREVTPMAYVRTTGR